MRDSCSPLVSADAAPSTPAPLTHAARVDWLGAAIVLVALVLRLLWLGEKPPHFDEGVNGWFVDQMTAQGFYHYDPTNFHGPLHFYVCFLAQTFLGRHVWALRLPIALVSTACVALALAFAPHFGKRAARLAAGALALSPGMIFYGRYAIHETWLLFFLMLGFWGIAGLWREGRTHHLWAAAVGASGMILTKETYAIHLVALGLAAISLRVLEKISPSSALAFSPQRWTTANAQRALLVCGAAILFFYTGGLLDWSSLPGLWVTFSTWVSTGTNGTTGHEKEWFYWLTLAARYEWPMLVGCGAALAVVLPQTDRLPRYLGIYALGTLVAYSLIPYKTPWCLIVMMWPFHLLFGAAIDRLGRTLDRWLATALAVVVLAHSAFIACRLNYREFTNEEEPYVYVQTLPDVANFLGPLQELARRDARNFHLIGYVFSAEQHPFAWLLGDFTRVNLIDAEHIPESLDDAEFLLIDATEESDVEAKLHDSYFKQNIRIRGSSPDEAIVYLRAKTFAPVLPGRTPEFTPNVPQ